MGGVTAPGRLALQVVPRMSDHQLTDSTCAFGPNPTLQQRSREPRSLLHYMPGCHSHACPAGHPLPGERGGARLEKKAQPQLEERRLPLSFIEEDRRQHLRKEEGNRHSLSCLAPPASVQNPSLRRAISSTALKQRQPGESHHRELIQLKEDAATSWIFAVRGEVVRQRACDEVSEEFRRAGIGHCFRGLHSLFFFATTEVLSCFEVGSEAFIKAQISLSQPGEEGD